MHRTREPGGNPGLPRSGERERPELAPLYGPANPLTFLDLQDVQKLSSFFGRRVSACQVGVTGEVAFDRDFWPRAGSSPPYVGHHTGGGPPCRDYGPG